MNRVVIFLIIFIVVNLKGQHSRQLVFSINGEKFYDDELIHNYNKNKVINSKNKDKFLRDFINYKLMIKYSKEVKLDTSNIYRDKTSKFKKKLITSYFYDNFLIKEFIDRSKKNIHISQFKLKTKDSTEAYDIYKKLKQKGLKQKNNSNYEIVYDGFISAMESRVEDIAYNLDKGQISKPFIQNNNYYIIKVNNIVILDKDFYFLLISINNNYESKIDTIYKDIKESNNWDLMIKKLEIYKDNIKISKPLTTNSNIALNFRKHLFDLYTSNKLLSKPFKLGNKFYIIKIIKKFNRNYNYKYKLKTMDIILKYNYDKNLIKNNLKNCFSPKYNYYIYQTKTTKILDSLYLDIKNCYKNFVSKQKLNKLNLIINDFNDLVLFNLVKNKVVDKEYIKSKYIVSLANFNINNLFK